MGQEPTLKELQQRIEQLEEAVDELKAWYTGLEQHIISATATLRVVVELAKGG
jgi:prefoldin subunit 5